MPIALQVTTETSVIMIISVITYEVLTVLSSIITRCIGKLYRGLLKAPVYDLPY